MQSRTQLKTARRVRRHKRVRSTVKGTASRPRLAVFRSNKYTYAQLIDDVAEKTLIAANSRGASGKTELERAKEVGAVLAKRALEKKITEAVFDRGGFLYAGRVKAVAEGARGEGLTL
ncbi:50S ribosomal protein L18 [Candidatus Wolfebacteria bacterium]|nr:50S ribosomal protein L18 [Candidatus Wolfebacteria bacterium]